MNEKASKSRNIFQIFALFLLLIAFPAGSWFYLSSGFDYQKSIWAQLKRYGEVSNYQLAAQKGKTLSKDRTKDKILLASFLAPSGKESELALQQLKRIHFQFDDRQDFLMLIHSLDGTREGADQLMNLLEKEEVKDDEQCLFLSGKAIESLLLNDYKKPATIEKADSAAYELVVDTSLPTSYPYFVLIDTKGMIRNYYDFRDEQHIARLVEHLAIILPRKKRASIEVKRETEK